MTATKKKLKVSGENGVVSPVSELYITMNLYLTKLHKPFNWLTVKDISEYATQLVRMTYIRGGVDRN